MKKQNEKMSIETQVNEERQKKIDLYFSGKTFEQIVVELTTETIDYFAPFFEVEPSKIIQLNPSQKVNIIPKHIDIYKLHLEFWFDNEIICVVKYEGEYAITTVNWYSEVHIGDVIDGFEEFIWDYYDEDDE